MAGVDGPTLLVAVAGVGLLAGYLGGLFGKGGSALATPVLAALGVPPLAAVASPLPASVPSMLASGREYRGAGFVDCRTVVATVATGLPATLLGAYATRWIGGHTLVVVTDLLLLAVGLRFVLRPSAPAGSSVDSGRQSDQSVRKNEQPGRMARAMAVGLAVGLLAGLLANAGGMLLAPLFVLVLRLPVKAAFGTSLAVALAFAVPGTIVHTALGHVDWALVAAFAAGSVPAAALGARTALRMDPVILERVYGVALVALAAALLVVSR